jgi:hypothetical protein
MARKVPRRRTRDFARADAHGLHAARLCAQVREQAGATAGWPRRPSNIGPAPSGKFSVRSIVNTSPVSCPLTNAGTTGRPGSVSRSAPSSDPRSESNTAKDPRTSRTTPCEIRTIAPQPSVMTTPADVACTSIDDPPQLPLSGPGPKSLVQAASGKATARTVSGSFMNRSVRDKLTILALHAMGNSCRPAA